jgi:hypothetical protein
VSTEARRKLVALAIAGVVVALFVALALRPAVVLRVTDDAIAS